jgi:hypothetical protein
MMGNLVHAVYNMWHVDYTGEWVCDSIVEHFYANTLDEAREIISRLGTIEEIRWATDEEIRKYTKTF